jgi:hypothetical protein
LLIKDPSTCLHCNSHFSCLLYLSFIIEAEKFFLCLFIFQLDFVAQGRCKFIWLNQKKRIMESTNGMWEVHQ